MKERFDEGSLQYKLLLSSTQIDPNCGYIILLSRLNDLLIRGKKDIFVRFYKDDLDFVQRIVDTRHYYTHYGENKRNKALKGDNLLDSICILSIILEYYVCDILGIDVSDQVANDLRYLVPYEHD